MTEKREISECKLTATDSNKSELYGVLADTADPSGLVVDEAFYNYKSALTVACVILHDEPGSLTRVLKRLNEVDVATGHYWSAIIEGSVGLSSASYLSIESKPPTASFFDFVSKDFKKSHLLSENSQKSQQKNPISLIYANLFADAEHCLAAEKHVRIAHHIGKDPALCKSTTGAVYMRLLAGKSFGGALICRGPVQSVPWSTCGSWHASPAELIHRDSVDLLPRSISILPELSDSSSRLLPQVRVTPESSPPVSLEREETDSAAADSLSAVPSTRPMFEAELAAFSRDFPSLLSSHPGQYAVYIGDSRVGVFPTRDEAFRAGYAQTKFQRAFFLRRIEATDTRGTSSWQVGRSIR